MADSVSNDQISLLKQLSGSLHGLVLEYARGHAPHALMLTGVFGVGKRTLSGLLSMTLLCEKEGKPCGECPGCRRVASSAHPNLLTLRAQAGQKTVKVEQARELLSLLSSYPFSPGHRVVLLEMADTFTPAAQNALLKEIEEPDAATFFILTAIQEKAVLPTIRSRCRCVQVPSWPEPLLIRLLKSHGISEDEARSLSTLCGGSPGKALRIKDDPQFWAAKKAADAGILDITSLSSFPAASKLLKDSRDSADLLLDYAESAALRDISASNPMNGGTKRARKLLEAVLTARKMRASNVSWQAVADELLFTILED